MDDILIFTKTKHQTERVVKLIYKAIKPLKLLLSKPKTYIGKIKNGFDFLGYHLGPENLKISKKSIEKFAGNLVDRLYQPGYSSKDIFRYSSNWLKYFNSGLNTNPKSKMNKKWKTTHSQQNHWNELAVLNC